MAKIRLHVFVEADNQGTLRLIETKWCNSIWAIEAFKQLLPQRFAETFHFQVIG